MLMMHIIGDKIDIHIFNGIIYHKNKSYNNYKCITQNLFLDAGKNTRINIKNRIDMNTRFQSETTHFFQILTRQLPNFSC